MTEKLKGNIGFFTVMGIIVMIITIIIIMAQPKPYLIGSPLNDTCYLRMTINHEFITTKTAKGDFKLGFVRDKNLNNVINGTLEKYDFCIYVDDKVIIKDLHKARRYASKNSRKDRSR